MRYFKFRIVGISWSQFETKNIVILNLSRIVLLLYAGRKIYSILSLFRLIVTESLYIIPSEPILRSFCPYRVVLFVVLYKINN